MHILKIKPMTEDVEELYSSHSTYHEGDSGLDLFFPEDVSFRCGETKLVDLGIRCEMEQHSIYTGVANVSYLLLPRSSISKTPLRLANSIGLIDAGYRGNILMALTYVPTSEDLLNIRKGGADDPLPVYTVKKGTRLGQISLPTLEPFRFKLSNELSETSRGTGGFGSTGMVKTHQTPETDSKIQLGLPKASQS